MTAGAGEALRTSHTHSWVSAQAPAVAGTTVCWVTSDVGIKTSPKLIQLPALGLSSFYQRNAYGVLCWHKTNLVKISLCEIYAE